MRRVRGSPPAAGHDAQDFISFVVSTLSLYKKHIIPITDVPHAQPRPDEPPTPGPSAPSVKPYIVVGSTRSLRHADDRLGAVLDGRASPRVARPLPLQGRGLLLRLLVVLVAIAGLVLPVLLHEAL